MIKAFGIAIATTLVIVLIVLGIWVNVTPSGRVAWNNWFHAVQKADDNTQYENRKTVEDTCRAMIASYDGDKSIIAMYDGNADSTMQSLADAARIRAARTVATYNNYVLKNSYVWSGNVPEDIRMVLEPIK